MRGIVWSVAGLALLVLSLGGCGRKTPLYAQPAQLYGDVHIDPYRVYVKGTRIYFETHVTNRGLEPIVIRRDAWMLRLSSGEMLQRSSGVTSTHAPYTIQPGETRRVFVDFRKDEGKLADEADGGALVVAGVSTLTDPTPRVVGELAVWRVQSDPAMAAPPREAAPVVAASLPPQAETLPPPIQTVQSPPTPATDPAVCVPGRSVDCAGLGGCKGFQVCAPTGKHYEPCQCVPQQ